MILIHELEKKNDRLLAKFHVMFVDLNLSKPLQKKNETKRLLTKTNTEVQTLWKFVAENHTENFATLKITLKNNIKESFTEDYTEKRPLLFRNAKNG